MDDGMDAKWEKLVAIAERLANRETPAPVINVNIDLASVLQARKKPISGKEVGDHDIPAPGGMPRPYVS